MASERLSLGMRPTVSVHDANFVEPFVTVITFERPLACMGHHMRFENFLSFRLTVVADWTFEVIVHYGTVYDHLHFFDSDALGSGGVRVRGFFVFDDNQFSGIFLEYWSNGGVRVERFVQDKKRVRCD